MSGTPLGTLQKEQIRRHHPYTSNIMYLLFSSFIVVTDNCQPLTVFVMVTFIFLGLRKLCANDLPAFYFIFIPKLKMLLFLNNWLMATNRIAIFTNPSSHQ